MQRQPRRRRRPALSCIECRRRKIKCDRNDPCSHCVSAGSDCTYRVYGSEPAANQHSQQQSSVVPISSPPLLTCTTPIQPQGYIRRNTPAGFGDDLVVPPAIVATAATVPNDTLKADRLPHQNHNEEIDILDLQHRIEKLENSLTPASTGKASEADADILKSHSGRQGSHIILNKTRILSASYWKTSTKELSPMMSCYLQATDSAKAALIQDAETRALVTQMDQLLRTAKHITKLIKMTRPSGSLADPDFSLVNPPRELADRMAALYFQSFESTHRILHISTFWAEYKTYWEHPESSPTSLRLKVLLVVGLGSSLDEERNPDADIRIMIYQWVHAAQTWLAGPLKKDRLDLNAIQIYCLTILARQVFSIGGDLVWMSMGSLIHRAMQIGLHRDPEYLPPMSLLQMELRRRLWATILELFVQSTLDAAMPPRISLDEFDTKSPSNINDNDIGEMTTALHPHPENRYTNTSIQRLLLKSLPTRLRIIELLHGLHTEISYLDVIALTTDIKNACRTNDEFLRRSESLGVSMFHRNLLDFLIRRFIIDLHCPFAVKARSNPLFYYSIKISIDTALAITTYPTDKHFSRLITIGGGMFREGLRCAGSVISYELIAQTEALRHDGTLHHNTQEIQSLKDAVNKMIEFSVERIKQGETNIKNHMFLSQIMAHVEAIEAGAPNEFTIAQSGRDSLQFCVNLLRQRANAISPHYSDNIDFTMEDFVGHEDNGMDFDLDLFLGEAEFS